jgi:hypothetical protein
MLALQMRSKITTITKLQGSKLQTPVLEQAIAGNDVLVFH